MAFMWKKYNGVSRGIIVLTHKETSLLSSFSKYRDRYLLGCHVGRHRWMGVVGGFDFYLASKCQLPDNFAEKDKIIEFNSRNFLPDIYHNTHKKFKASLIQSINEMHKVSTVKISQRVLNKITETNKDYVWDILWVNKPHSVKNIKIFLDQLKILFRQEGPCEVLLVCAFSPNEHGRNKSHFLDVETYIKNIFTHSETTHISLLRPDTPSNEGADNSLMPPFYQWSNVFAFYSEKEGEARAAHEALCCGNRVVYYSFLESATTDYLNEQNSIPFSDFNESWRALYNAVSLSKISDCKNIHTECLIKNSLPRFKRELNKLYNKHGDFFDWQLLDVENLHFELPAHNHKVKWKSPKNETGDLTPKYLDVFIKTTGLDDAPRYDTKKILNSLEWTGYYVISGMYSKEFCDSVVKQMKFHSHAGWGAGDGKDQRCFHFQNKCEEAHAFMKNPLFEKLCVEHSKSDITRIRCQAGIVSKEGGSVDSGGGWHVDHHVKQFKALLYLHDVDERGGPFAILASSRENHRGIPTYSQSSSDTSETRYHESTLKEYSEWSRLKVLTGQIGDVVLVDTSNIHRGIEIEEGTRYTLTNYYYTENMK